MSAFKVLSSFKSTRAQVLPKLQGNVFTVFRNANEIITRHPLDTDREEYADVVKNYVIPVCKEIVPQRHSYHGRLGGFLEYNNPAFDLCWNFNVELMFKMVYPVANHTRDNLTLMRILRAVMDINFTMTAIVDDIADGSDQRQNQPTWYTICHGGPMAAVYDAMVCSQLPLFLIRHYFKDEIGYGRMLEAVSKGTLHTLIGQNMDFLGRHSADSDEYRLARSFKAGKLFQIGPTLGLLHASIMDRDLIQKVENIFYHFGIIAQIWDDFLDAYGEPRLTGKRGIDSVNATSSWASTTARLFFDKEQLALFADSFGSSEAGQRDTIKGLYDEINLPLLYLKEMNDRAYIVYSLIDSLSDERVRQACSSYAEWCLGSLEEMKELRSYLEH